MESELVLQKIGINKDNYPADAVFSDSYIGTYSEDRKTVCIMLADNLSNEDLDNLDNCIIPLETVKEIAYTVNTLITDFGLELHSYTAKNHKPFNTLKIIRPCDYLD